MTNGSRTIADGLIAGSVAAVLSGAPSTLHSLVTGEDVLEPSLAAGSMLLRSETRTVPLLLAAVPVHVALSLGWGIALAAVLPRERTMLGGALAGVAIAGLDLGFIGPRFPRIAALPTAPQIADHVAFGLIVGFVLKRRRGSSRFAT